MGLENRDYLKGGGYSSSFGGSTSGGWSVTQKLIVINVAVFLLQTLGGPAVSVWLVMKTPDVMSGQVWRLLSYGFAHSDDLLHILVNMMLLYWFGPRLESIYGSREFLWFYLTSIVIAGVAYMGIDLITGDAIAMLGASGGVMAVLTLYACHFPRQVIYLFFVIPIELRWLVGLYAAYDLYPLLKELASGSSADNVAHAAHLGGMAFGYLYFQKRFRLESYVTGITTLFKARKKGFKVVRGDDDDSASRSKLAAEMDRILDKISREGEVSLTKKERRTLEKASRELRSKKQT